MHSGNRGIWPYVVGTWAVAMSLVMVGTADVGPFPAVRAALPAGEAGTVTLVGFGASALALGVTALVVAVKVTVFLLALVFRGREALDRLPDVDPLVGGAMGVLVIATGVMGGGAAMTTGVGDSSGVPYVGESTATPAISDPHGVVRAEDLAGFGGDEAALPAYDDADGDRLPDAWERAGETPWGTPLPGADPDHKDLYVQVTYAEGQQPLNDTERGHLRRIWAGLPVANPDGAQGVDVHFVEPGAASANVTVGADGVSASFVRTYYSPEYLGERRCSHYAVVFADVEGADGWAVTPGYLAVVDGGERGRTAGTTGRVLATTHLLLHAVVGPVGGDGAHVERGWLGTGPMPRLSEPTSSHLNDSGFARAPGFETELCDRPVGANASDGG